MKDLWLQGREGGKDSPSPAVSPSDTHSLCPCVQTAKSNLEKAVSEMAAASDEAAKAEAQIKVEANEALVKALE